MRGPIFLLLFLLTLILSGCSSVSLSVNSVPEKAKVFVRQVGGGEAVEMGETPLVLNGDQLKGAGAASGPVFVEVTKKDFKTERVLVTESSAVDMKIDFALKLEDETTGTKGPGNTLGDAQTLNLAIDRLFEVKKYVALESYGEALKHLRYIEDTWPYLSATYEMKGGILFLQKKYRDALAAYSMSLKYNPKSVASFQMVEDLESKLGIKGEDLTKEYERSRRMPAATGEDKEGSSASKSKSKTTKKKKRSRRKKKVSK